MVDFKKERASKHHRRGISTIVGGAIFLILFASAFSTFFIAMDVQRDTIITQRAISENILDKTQENFVIAVSADDANSNRLAIQVKNLGTNPIEVGNIWIVNKSGDFPAQKHLIDYKDSVIPSGYGTDILDSTPLFMNADDYDIKVVSTLGTIKKSGLTIGTGNNLRATLLAIPPEVKVGQNVTLTMHVENIGNTRLLNVAPVNDTGKLHPNISPEFTTPHPAPPLPVDLDPGEGAFFTWKYETTGTANSFVLFNANATATEEVTGFSMRSNTAYEEIELKEPDLTEITVLTQDLVSRPEIFMVIPAPIGDDNTDYGLWGMNVVNPTVQPMNITKVVISAMVPRANAGDQIFPTGCDPQNIFPPAGSWSCPSPNQLVWTDDGDDFTIPPLNVSPFLATTKPGQVSGSPINIEAAIVQGNVYTSVGQFGKAAYGSSMDFQHQIIANVFLTNVTETSTNDRIIANITNIAPSSTVKFNATMAEFASRPGERIETGSLIINVPKDWSAPVNLVHNGFNNPQITSFSDGSHQIIGELSGPIDGTTIRERTIQFESTAPAVTSTQMYVMYILGEGVATNGFKVAPLAEVVLHVKP